MTHRPGQYKVIEHSWEDTSIVGRSGKTLCRFSIHDLGRVTESNQDNLESVQQERVSMVLNAVNSHAALLEALKDARDSLCYLTPDKFDDATHEQNWNERLDRINKTITQAEGGA